MKCRFTIIKKEEGGGKDTIQELHKVQVTLDSLKPKISKTSTKVDEGANE